MTGSGGGGGQGRMIEEVTFSLIGECVLHQNMKCNFAWLGPELAGKGQHVGKQKCPYFCQWKLSKLQEEVTALIPTSFTWMIMKHIVDQAWGIIWCCYFCWSEFAHLLPDSGVWPLFPCGGLWLLSILQTLSSGWTLKMSRDTRAPRFLMWEIVPGGI